MFIFLCLFHDLNFIQCGLQVNDHGECWDSLRTTGAKSTHTHTHTHTPPHTHTHTHTRATEHTPDTYTHTDIYSLSLHAALPLSHGEYRVSLRTTGAKPTHTHTHTHPPPHTHTHTHT